MYVGPAARNHLSSMFKLNKFEFHYVLVYFSAQRYTPKDNTSTIVQKSSAADLLSKMAAWANQLTVLSKLPPGSPGLVRGCATLAQFSPLKCESRVPPGFYNEEDSLITQLNAIANTSDLIYFFTLSILILS
jgi:hypothetical protein